MSDDIPVNEKPSRRRRWRAVLWTCLLAVAVAMLLAVRANTTFHRSIEGLPMSKETRTYCLGRGSLTLPADIIFSFYDPFVKDYRDTDISVERVNKERPLSELKKYAEHIKTNFYQRLQPFKTTPANYVLITEKNGTNQDGEWWFGYEATINNNRTYTSGDGILLINDRLITFHHYVLNLSLPANAADREAIEAHMKAMMASVRRLEPGKMPDEPALCFGDGYFALPEEADETIGGAMTLTFPGGLGYGWVGVEVDKSKDYAYDPKESPLALFPKEEAEAIPRGVFAYPLALGHRMVDGMDGEHRVLDLSDINGGWSRQYEWTFFGQAPDKPYTHFDADIQKQARATVQDWAWNLALDGWRTHR